MKSSCSKCFIRLMNLDQFPVECDHLFIFSSPRIGSPVVRISKTAHSGFIPIINRRRANPRHLKCCRFSHHCRFNKLIRRFRSEMLYTPNYMIGSCKKSGVVVIRKLVHRRKKRRHQHIRHVVRHCAYKMIRISAKLLSHLITVFFHPRQKPCDWLHESVIIHNSIPLITLKPFTGISIMLRQNDGIWIRFFYYLTEFLPETMIILITLSKIRCYIKTPSIHIVGRRHPFLSNTQNIIF